MLSDEDVFQAHRFCLVWPAKTEIVIQRHTRVGEAIPQGYAAIIYIQSRSHRGLCQVCRRLPTMQGKPGLYRAPLVVLEFHLQVGDIGFMVATEAVLVATELAVVVIQIQVPTGRIEVGILIGKYSTNPLAGKLFC